MLKAIQLVNLCLVHLFDCRVQFLSILLLQKGRITNLEDRQREADNVLKSILQVHTFFINNRYALKTLMNFLLLMS